jgi:hypothetical protein
LIAESRTDLIVYDIDTGDDEARGLITAIGYDENAPSLILLSEKSDAPLLRDLVDYPSGYNLVLKEGIIDNGDLLVTARKLVNRDIFGLEKYLRWGGILHTYQPSSSEERNILVSRLEEFLAELQCDSRYVNDFANATDEFVSNAFFHAPTEEGVSLHSLRPRNQVITLPTWRRPTFEYGSDGRLVGIACRDPFGSLDVKRVLERLADHIKAKQAEVSDGPGGAGIGLYVTYRAVDHLIINVEPGVATEFIALIDVTAPYREHVTRPRSLNVFMLDAFTD